MKQSPSGKANRFSASQELPRILGNSKAHYRIHNSPPPLPILSQLDPVHTPTPYFLKIYRNIIFSSKSGSGKWSLSLRFPHQNPVYATPLPHTRYMTLPSHFSRFYHSNNIGWGVHIIQLLIMQLLPLPCYLIPPWRTGLNTKHIYACRSFYSWAWAFKFSKFGVLKIKYIKWFW